MVTTRSKSSKLNADTSGVIPDSPTPSDSSGKGASPHSKKGKFSFAGNYAQLIIFLSLVLDLLAFTIILPLYPSLMQYYKSYDPPNGAYGYLESKMEYFRRLVGAPAKHNGILFGGFLGSLFSFLQFLALPIVGALSDVYGRKPVILLCLIGITWSYWLWSRSTTFLTFILARVVGGISKGNLSCSMAAMTDVSSSDKRASGMAMIGAAFSVGFVVGPMIGAFCKNESSNDYMWFAKPALLAMGLSFADIIFVIVMFRETLPKEKRLKSVASSLQQAFAYINVKDLFLFSAVKNMSTKDLKQLRSLGVVYFLHLLLYSSLEFNLTFLTHWRFQFTPMQQGMMFFVSGIIMAVAQGTFVRRIPSESVQFYASIGLLFVAPAYVCIGLAPTTPVLYVGISIYALATSLVVPCMTTIASKYGTSSQKGTALGIFRSLGTLARAIGPIFGCIGFWSFGPQITYCVGGVLLLIPWFLLRLSPTMKV